MAISEFNGTQNFFLTEIIEGTIGTGKGGEFDNNRGSGTYMPM